MRVITLYLVVNVEKGKKRKWFNTLNQEQKAKKQKSKNWQKLKEKKAHAFAKCKAAKILGEIGNNEYDMIF